MFRALINDAKSAAGSTVSKYIVKYLARVCVALPFIWPGAACEQKYAAIESE
jgi:hypothetical protein